MVHAFVETHNMYFITSVITCQLIDRECLAGRENKRCAGRWDDSIGYDQNLENVLVRRRSSVADLLTTSATRSPRLGCPVRAHGPPARRITLLRAASNLQEWQTWT